MDIHSSAARLRPNPMLPNAAKAASNATRTAKRAITRLGLRARVMSDI
jgi:hypothetical protein